jgi:hypothetical protein
MLVDPKFTYRFERLGYSVYLFRFYNKKKPWMSKGFGVTYQKRCYDMQLIPEIIPEYFEGFYGTGNK